MRNKLATVFSIGSRLQYLSRGPSFNADVKGESYLYDNLTKIKNDLEELKYEPYLKQIEKMLDKMSSYEEKTPLNKEDGNKLKRLMDEIYSSLISDLNNIILFEAIDICSLDKGNLVKLMNKQESAFFEKDVWKKLSKMALIDFSDSAKCLLVGASTPATMITLRATEEMVRKYYENKTGNTATGEFWGRITTDLKKISGINSDLIDHLDYIRKARRNFAQHPGKVFGQREAERIFMEAISAVHEMCHDM